MFWQENIKEEAFSIPEDIIDVPMQIKSAILPIDHSFLLKNALCKELDCNQENLAFFDISVADGNGWEQDKSGFFYPSARTKLVIRIKKEALKSVQNLAGKTLDLGEYKIQIKKVKDFKKLSDSSIIFSKMLVCDEGISENDFLQKCFDDLQKIGITPKKMLAGLSRKIKINDEILTTKSLMIADLSKPDSVKLQENGLGKYQLFGCGIFLPQKGIDSVDAV